MNENNDPRLLKGKKVAERIISEVNEEMTELKKRGVDGKLVSISIGNVPEADVYIRGQKRNAEKAGIIFEEQKWDKDITQEEAKNRIVALDDDSETTGIILQRPVPNHIHGRSLQSAIHPLKDVEGMNPASIGNIIYNDIALAPCTAAAAVEMLKETGLKLEGLEVVVIGHSEIVGKPTSLMLMAEGATVTVCHHQTRSVAMHSRRADAVIVAVGKPHLVGADMIRPGAAVIDIGINQIKDKDGKTKIVGDANTDEVKEIASWVTPVPGGVGPVTVAMLMRNAMRARQKQITAGWIVGM